MFNVIKGEEMAKKSEQLVSCLKNERVIVKHIPRENSMVGNNPKHVLYGGMAENSTRTYVVPQLRNGQLVDVLTKDEKDFLEDYLGLEDNALSVYNIENNFWKKQKVVLHKDNNVFDLSNPMDYIKVKILLHNTDLIAPSLTAVQNNPKATYEYVIIRENEENKVNRRRIDATKEAYKEYGKIEEDRDTMRVIIETLTASPVAATMTLDSMVSKIDELIQHDAKTFLKVAQDPMLKTKVLIRNAIDAGVIVNRAGQLYLRDGGTPLCDKGEATLSVASAYLNEIRNQELRFTIEAKVNQYKENH